LASPAWPAKRGCGGLARCRSTRGPLRSPPCSSSTTSGKHVRRSAFEAAPAARPRGNQRRARHPVVLGIRKFCHACASTRYDLLSRGQQGFVTGRWSAAGSAASGTPGQTKLARGAWRAGPTLPAVVRGKASPISTIRRRPDRRLASSPSSAAGSQRTAPHPPRRHVLKGNLEPRLSRGWHPADAPRIPERLALEDWGP
jgi:hypothetical protein